MSLITQDIDALTVRFLDGWTRNDVPVNFDYQQQANVSIPRCHFSVIMGASKQAYGDAITGAKLQQGRVWFDAIVPDEDGTSLAFELLEAFISIFRNWTDGRIVCRTEDMSSPWIAEDASVRFRVSIPWESVRPYSG